MKQAIFNFLSFIGPKTRAGKWKAYRWRALSGILLLVFLMSTWFLFYQQPKYSEELHINLQQQLKQIISSALKEQKPMAHNLQFQRMVTQAGSKKNHIKAHFQYSFDEEDGLRLALQGQALLLKQKSDSQQELWTVKSIKTNNTRLEFSQPVVLSASTQDSSVTQENSLKEPSPSLEPVDSSQFNQPE